jgi:hypothetical protein
MAVACANIIETMLRARGPSRKLDSISNRLVKDIDGASPDVEVLQFGLGPASMGEDVER